MKPYLIGSLVIYLVGMVGLAVFMEKVMTPRRYYKMAWGQPSTNKAPVIHQGFVGDRGTTS